MIIVAVELVTFLMNTNIFATLRALGNIPVVKEVLIMSLTEKPHFSSK